ncbi:protein TASOR 2-like isoform X2 [Solea solea]|uniref:protein TASOR 2-like isoform X2 n=1 Tax=Solea solea TaxID=90069 RepID=UPI00272BB633|nr:protein TASOR 2-like isoform X2 [Solea solea]
MQSYAALINPGLELSPSREVGIFPEQYDILPAHKHLYSSPEWTNKAWHSLRSYVSKPASFQLSLSKASEIMAVQQDEQRYDLDDDVYIRPSSPEEVQTTLICMGSEDQVTEQRPSANVETSTDRLYGSEDQVTGQRTVNVETSMNNCTTSIETHVDLTAGPQNDKSDDLQPEDATSDSENWTVLIKTDGIAAKDPLTPATSDDLPAELIVSITSAERSVTDESLSLINTMSTMKHDDFQISGISEAKLQTAELIHLHDENVDIKSKDSPQATHFINAKPRKLRRGHSIVLKRAPKACSETLTLQTIKKAGSISMRQKEDQARELSSPSNTHWKKLRRQRWKFGKLSSKNKIVRCSSVGLRVAEKRKSSKIGQGSLLMGHEMCPPRKKIEHWDLKPVVSECGRILVPHGSLVTVQIQSLKDQVRFKNYDPEKKLVDASVNACNKVEMDQDSSTETAVEDTETTTSKSEVSQTENLASCLKEHIPVTQSNNGAQPLNPKHGEHSSKADVIDHPSSEEPTKKNTDSTSPRKFALKGKLLLNKLKSVLLRGKRKTCMTDGSKDSADNTEPCLKKGKGDSDAGVVKINDEALTGQDNVVVKGVSEMLSVDPLFAYALGLTPIEKPEVQKSEGRDCQQRRVSSETQEQTIVSKQQPQIIPSALLKQRRTKTLKKHQSVSEECVKKTWWLHFQTPACLDAEKPKYKEQAKDISVMKTVKENMNSTCSSADALNLLADLALSASNDLFPPQATFGRKPETNKKRCELTKDVASAEQESVLHALLRQPAARPIQPLECSSSHLMGDKEMVDLISKEHNYSLPLSSPLVLGLSGTPFQEDGGESTYWTQESMKKHLECKKKFSHSRSFVNKYKSVEVTKQWKGKYDFHGDSKLASDPKSKGVMRALHGPWDFTIQDTTEDIRLIVHMWIGLFYSRSTPRLFHIDSNFTNPCPEESESLEMSTQTVPTPLRTELKPNALSSIASTQDNSDNVVLDEGSTVLDLSLRNSNAESVTSDPHINQENASVSGEQKEASEKLSTLKPSLGLQEASTLQCCTRADSTEITDDHRSHCEDDKTCIPSQKTGCSEDIGMPSLKGLFILPQEKMKSVSNLTENDPAASGIGHMLHGFSKGKTCMKGDANIPQTTEMTYIQHTLDSSKHGKEKESTMGGKEIDHTDENNESQTKDWVNCPEKENPCQEAKNELSPKMEICTGEGAANKDSSCIDGNSFEKEKFSREEHKATPTQSENNVEFWSVHEGKLIIDEDAFGRHEIDAKAMETGNEKYDQPLPMLHDSPDSVEKGGPTDCSLQTLIHEQASQAEDSCHDLNLGKSALTDKHVISEKAPHIPCGTESINKDTAVEETPEMDHCLNEGEHYQEVAIPVADKSYSSLDGSCVTESFPLKKDCLETGSKNTVVQVNSGISSDDHEVEETKSVVIQGMDDNTAREKSFHHHSPPPQYEVMKKCEEALTKETSVKMDKTNEQMGISSSAVVFPFSGRNVVDTTHPQDKTEDVQCQKGIPLISDAVDPNLLTEVGKTPDLNSRREKLYSDRIFPLNVTETIQQVVFGSESDERCPTPTLDEKPSESIPGPTSDSNIAKISENTSPRQLDMGSKPAEDKMLAKQKLCQKSRFDCDPSPHYSQDPDLELRTLRVLQSVDKFLSTSNHVNNASQVETAVNKNGLDQNPNRKPIPAGLDPSHISRNLKNKKILYLQPVVVSASNSPLKTKLVEVLGVQLQLDKMDMSLQDSFERKDNLQGSSTRQGISPICRSPTEGLQAKKANVPDRYKTSQSGLNHESFSHSRRPIVAVKPSMSDESQADRITKDGHIEYPEVTCTIPITMPLEGSENFMGNSKPNDKQESNKSSSRSSHLSNINSIKANLVLQKNPLLDHSYQYKGRNRTSSLSAQSLKSAKKHKSKNNSEMKLKDCSKASTSIVAANDDSAIEDSLIKEPQTSLTCTVFNTDQKSSYSFLEQVSKRCLQDDFTQASIEQEHLILSEKMKQLLKRKRTTTGQQDTHGHLNLSHSSPVTVCFSGLEDQEDLLDLIDAPSLVGQKIKVDMSNKTGMADSTKEKELPEIDKLKEHGGLSGVTAKCVRSYETMMDEVCSAKKAQSTPKHFQKDRNNKNVEPSHNFDVCDQMKRRMDESFRSYLNSVVKKSWKTKYRFYILETSDDDLFKETKAQMESEGHSAIQPTEFFHGENSSSSLLIILRNEDIAEHISKVPRLLELKKTPGVQFAGIDEPDDVVNLTHQELFTQGGFIMFDRAALGDISLCNMKKCSEILHELSKTGKWKWMVHYRDSRRLKENARLSAEAKEKQFFLNSCRDAGILEVLPYHECDAMSRHQPDYLTCLVRLQVHNISARYPVFITDATTDGTFGRNGIFTLTVNSFLTNSSSEIFLFKKSNG